MDSRKLTCIISSIVSQITLLIILLYPSHNHHRHSETLNSQFQTLISLIHHFLSSSDALAVARTRKRTRTHLPESDSDPDPSFGPLKLGRRLGRVDSVLVKNPDSFRVTFKMSSSSFEWLCELLEPLLECRDPAHLPMNDLSAELRLGIGLYRLATGSSYDEVADRFGVADRVARFCTKQLCRVLCTNFRFWVGFPGPNEARSSFDQIVSLPNCSGVIGCTRFPIKNEHEHDSDSDSVAAQIVVDASCRILSIVAGFHGSKTDVEILKSSTFYKDVESGILLDGEKVNVCDVDVPQYLVGSKGYPLLPWLITPFNEHDHENDNDKDDNSIKAKFNECHSIITRVTTQKTFASLRNWGILSKPFDEEYKDGVAYIGSCAILHNALLLREDFSSLCDVHDDNSSTKIDDCRVQYDHDIVKKASSTEGFAIRNALATYVKDSSCSKMA